MHARTSGLADYLANDELDAIRIGRRIVARLNWRKKGPVPAPVVEPKFDPEELIGIVPADLRIPFDPRDVIARIVDGSDFDEFKPLYGSSLVTGWATLYGYSDRDPGQCPGGAVQRGVAEGHRSSSSWPTGLTPRFCSCTTPPATWWVSSTKRAA